MKIISSSRMWFYKKVLPVFFLFLAGAVAFLTFLSVSGKTDAPPLPFDLFPMAMLAFVFFIFKKLVFDLADEVDDCGDYLVIKFKGQEEQVFLSNIINISYSYLNPPRATLTLRQPCRFGKEVVFCPQTSFSDFFQSLHFRNSIVEDLIERVDAARRKA